MQQKETGKRLSDFFRLTRGVAAGEALVPFFDHGRVSVADDLSGDVVVPLTQEDSSRLVSWQGLAISE
jgi:hypothetical protein